MISSGVHWLCLTFGDYCIDITLLIILNNCFTSAPDGWSRARASHNRWSYILSTAIREILGSDVVHRTNHYRNNRLEQDHRGIKQRYYPMRGFGNFTSASRFGRAFDEVRQFFRVRSIMKQKVSLVQQREMFRQRLEALKALVLVA
jgi:DDE domain